MYRLSDDVIEQLEPNRFALALFLRPYATDERLWRIADQDYCGREKYFSDYRKYFDTITEYSCSEDVDDEAARYTHYELRDSLQIPDREAAIHAALSGALGIWRGHFCGWEFGSAGSLILALPHLPAMREPLLRTLAHYAFREEEFGSVAVFYHAYALLVAAGIERMAKDARLVEELCSVLSLNESYAFGELGCGSKRMSHRWLIRCDRMSDSEWPILGVLADRELPGPFSGEAGRTALGAIRLRLNGEKLMHEAVQPDLDSREPRLFTPEIREILKPDTEPLTTRAANSARTKVSTAFEGDPAYSVIRSFAETRVARPGAELLCGHILHCHAAESVSSFSGETVTDDMALSASVYLLSLGLARGGVFVDGAETAVFTLLTLLQKNSILQSEALAFLSGFAERYPYPRIVFKEFRDWDRAHHESDFVFVVTALVMIASQDEKTATNEDVMSELLSLLSRAEEEIFSDQTRHSLGGSEPKPWLHRTVFFSEERIPKEWDRWSRLAEYFLPGPHAYGKIRDTLMIVRDLLSQRRRVSPGFQLSTPD